MGPHALWRRRDVHARRDAEHGLRLHTRLGGHEQRDGGDEAQDLREELSWWTVCDHRSCNDGPDDGDCERERRRHRQTQEAFEREQCHRAAADDDSEHRDDDGRAQRLQPRAVMQRPGHDANEERCREEQRAAVAVKDLLRAYEESERQDYAGCDRQGRGRRVASAPTDARSAAPHFAHGPVPGRGRT